RFRDSHLWLRLLCRRSRGESDDDSENHPLAHGNPPQRHLISPAARYASNTSDTARAQSLAATAGGSARPIRSRQSFTAPGQPARYDSGARTTSLPAERPGATTRTPSPPAVTAVSTAFSAATLRSWSEPFVGYV